MKPIRGYFGIGVESLSKPMNLGALQRTAHAFGAAFTFSVSAAPKIRVLHHADTAKSDLHVPWYLWDTIDDMQREINLPGPIGVIQLVRNTAEATIKGIEIDATLSLTDNLVALASVGITDAGYDKVLYDLNGDSVINGTDKALDLECANRVMGGSAINVALATRN